MDLSIIVPVYNASQTINRCLNSIFSQSTQYTFEVILVDDGSVDDSVKQIKARNETNIILHQQENAGPATARNKGIKLANGRFCAFLDADDYWENGYIENTIGFMKGHSECVAVTVGQHHKTISGDFYFPEGWIHKKDSFVIGDFFDQWVKYRFVGTCATTMRMDAVRKIGGQRTDLFANEDFEFWFCLSTCGKWGFIPQILYVGDGGEVSKKGWVEKNIKRWYNAGSVESWQCRLDNLIPDKEKTSSYFKACGIVAWGIIYCQLLSGRFRMSWKQCLKYGKYFEPKNIAKLMNMAKHTYLSWYLLCLLLKYREYHR
mgnify:CR=1 FL=1